MVPDDAMRCVCLVVDYLLDVSVYSNERVLVYACVCCICVFITRAFVQTDCVSAIGGSDDDGGECVCVREAECACAREVARAS